MKKKLSLMLCLCIMALTLAACGSADPQDVDYGGMSYSDLQSSAQNLVTSIAASSEEEYLRLFRFQMKIYRVVQNIMTQTEWMHLPTY